MRGAKRTIGAVLSLVCVAGEAEASRPGPRDYFLDPPAAGLWGNVDVFTAGVQASLEHRLELDGDLTMLTSRVSALGSLGYGDVGAHVDFRAALFTVGASAGYRQVWRNYPVPNGQESTRDVRLKLDKPPEDPAERLPYERNSKGWPWAEGRVRMVIPLDSLWFVANGALRHESAPDNSYDWFHTNVHDGGKIWRADATLFYRNEYFGAIGPTIRYMRLPRHDGDVNELAYGFTFGTRPGWKRRTDLFLVQFLTSPSDDTFGFHILRSPIYAMLIYRASFGLSVPPRPY